MMKKKMTLWGITIQTDTHGEDVDAAAADDDRLLLSYLPVRRCFLSTM